MNILQVITDDDRRGAQVFAVDLQAALEKVGHQVRTVALAPGRIGGLDVRTLGPSARSVPTLRALRHRISGVDIAIAHGSSTLLATAIATIGLRKPWVYRQISESLYWAGTRPRRLRVRAYLRRPTRVVSLSAPMGDVLVRHFGVRQSQLRVIPNGVPGDAFGPATVEARADARQRLGLLPDRPVVLSIGALTPEKGVDVVIDAAATLDGVQVLVVGDGPAGPDLVARGKERLDDRMRFTGSLDDLHDVFAAADLIALPSRGGDVMPAVLIEAGLCGLPAVVTDVGAIAEVVKHGETGLVVAHASAEVVAAACGELLGDDPRRQTMGLAARRRCLGRYEITPVAAAWAQLLDEAVHGDQ